MKPLKFSIKHNLRKWFSCLTKRFEPSDMALYYKGEFKIKQDMNLLRLIQNI